MSLRTKLPIGVLGDDRGTLLDIISPCQQDMGGHSGPWTPQASRVPQVMVGLAMDLPLEAIFFPGILDGLTGRLGLMPPGVVDPPTLARAGVMRQWAATLREAVMRNEGRDIVNGPVTC